MSLFALEGWQRRVSDSLIHPFDYLEFTEYAKVEYAVQACSHLPQILQTKWISLIYFKIRPTKYSLYFSKMQINNVISMFMHNVYSKSW